MDRLFNVGERVTRPIDVYNPKSPIRHGIILERYSDKFDQYESVFDYDIDGNPMNYERVLVDTFHYPELYGVQWDDGKVEKGFFRHGLDKE